MDTIKAGMTIKAHITIGRESTLIGDDLTGCGVEGYEIGKKYKVDHIGVRDGEVQIFLEGNIHGYPTSSFK